MCGITGFIGLGDKETLVKMTRAVKHRGPDDEGLFFDQKNSLGLGHARLSILDLSQAGHQPMWSADGKVAVVFNGEIYNFRQLRDGLQKEFNYSFESGTDTEVIIYAYKAYGLKCFDKFEGMFAIALYDFDQKRLILARDRAGEKPLHWSFDGKTFLFASELKSLFIHPSFKKELDKRSIIEYLERDYIPTPFTIWKGTNKLEAGSYLVFDLSKKTYESKKFGKMCEVGLPTITQAKDHLGKLIEESVKNRLVADVPVGIFLSGGLDSSTIAYYAKKNNPSGTKTFSIGFSEKSFDESSYAREVANFLGTEHHEKIFKGEDALNIIPEILNHLDEPLGDASIIPTYLLAKFTREYVTVALGGDGGDELFAGYPTFQAEKLANLYLHTPRFFRKKIIEPLILSLPSSARNFSLDFKLKKFIEAFDTNENNSIFERHKKWLGTFDCGEYRRDYRGDTSVPSTEVSPRYELGNQLLLEYERTYLMDQVLVKTDRATMLTSLEARSPLLDSRLVNFAHSLPYHWKIHGLTTKYILKKMMADKLPKNIVNRPKKGFGMPVGHWLRGPLREISEEIISKEVIESIGVLDYEFVKKLKIEHYSFKADHRKKLWNLFVLSWWWRIYRGDTSV